MKNKIFSITLAMVLILISAPAWSYTAEVGFVKWVQNSHYTSGEYRFTEDFIGTAGNPVAQPPFRYSEGEVALSGSMEGSLLMTNNSYPGNGRTSVALPYDNTKSLSQSRLMVNLRSGLPDTGYTFGLGMHPSDTNYVEFGIYQDPVVGSGMYFLDETHPINNSKFDPLKITYSIESFSSIALLLRSDDSGVFTAWYQFNPPDGDIPGSNLNWVQFGTETSLIGTTGDPYAGFGVGTTSVPLPATILLLGSGLACVAGLRRKFGN